MLVDMEMPDSAAPVGKKCVRRAKPDDVADFNHGVILFSMIRNLGFRDTTFNFFGEVFSQGRALWAPLLSLCFHFPGPNPRPGQTARPLLKTNACDWSVSGQRAEPDNNMFPDGVGTMKQRTSPGSIIPIKTCWGNVLTMGFLIHLFEVKYTPPKKTATTT